MNVAIVLMKYNPFGGYERQAALLVDALLARGDSVTVLASEWKGDTSALEGKGGPSNVQASLKFIKVPIIRISSWLKVLSFALRTRRVLQKSGAEFDVVVAFDRTLVMDIYRAGNACHKEWLAYRRENNGLFDSLSIAANMLHRVINTIEESIFERIKSGKAKAIVLSKSGMEQIGRHYSVAPNTFTIIPPAIDLKRLDSHLSDRSSGKSNGVSDVQNVKDLQSKARAGLGISESTLLLLHIGSGFKIKGLSSTINALAELVGRGKDAVLLIAGSDKKETTRLKEKAKRLGIEERVRFLGGVSDVATLYNAADLFVVPSHFETFGIVFMEALYMGLPVIVGRGAGAAAVIEEFAHHGAGIGRVVTVPADPKELADRIEEVTGAEREFKAGGLLEAVKERRRQCALQCAPETVMKKFLDVIDAAARTTKATG